MEIFRRLFDSKEAREKREKAERIAEETELKRATKEITARRLAEQADAKRSAERAARQPKCERCGRPADQLIPVQLRAAGTDRSLDLNVCSDCFSKAAGIAEDIGFKFK